MQEGSNSKPNDSKVYLVGSGIASLASATYLIKDAGVSGDNIHILEQEDVLGGALDGAGDADNGYLIRGGRMHEEHFVCYWDLLSNIPSYDEPRISVKDESFEFSSRFVSHAQARLLKHGEKMDLSSFELTLKDQADLLRCTGRRKKAETITSITLRIFTRRLVHATSLNLNYIALSTTTS